MQTILSRQIKEVLDLELRRLLVHRLLLRPTQLQPTQYLYVLNQEFSTGQRGRRPNPVGPFRPLVPVPLLRLALLPDDDGAPASRLLLQPLRLARPLRRKPLLLLLRLDRSVCRHDRSKLSALAHEGLARFRRFKHRRAGVQLPVDEANELFLPVGISGGTRSLRFHPTVRKAEAGNRRLRLSPAVEAPVLHPRRSPPHGLRRRHDVARVQPLDVPPVQSVVLHSRGAFDPRHVCQ